MTTSKLPKWLQKTLDGLTTGSVLARYCLSIASGGDDQKNKKKEEKAEKAKLARGEAELRAKRERKENEVSIKLNPLYTHSEYSLYLAS